MTAHDHKAVSEAIAVFDKSAARTTPNAQTEAWTVIRAELEKLRQRCEELESLAKRVAGAPVAIMDTRHALGLCAPTEGDFPALYALQGKRVALVEIVGGEEG